MSPTYAREKLNQIIHSLTTGDEAIVERLRKAGTPHLVLLDEDSFPKEVRELWVEISNMFKDDMKNKTLTVEQAGYIAEKLLYIQHEMEQSRK